MMYGFTTPHHHHRVLEVTGWAMDGAVGDSHSQTSLQYRNKWETRHGQVTADGGVGTSGKCAYWPRAWEKGVAKEGTQPQLVWD